MKKLYFFICLSAFAGLRAQHTLTKANSQPVTGDTHVKIGYDTTAAVPKQTGANQVWNFVTLVANSYSETSTYTTVAATPSPAVFPNATHAENQGNGSYTMWKFTNTTSEVQGIQFNGAAVNFSNTAVFATFPIALGYNVTDGFAGSGTSNSLTASFDGSVTVNASGTGTVILPGGMTFTNCLQLVTTIIINQNFGGSLSSTVQREYSYYHSAHKFPIVSILYSIDNDMSGTDTSFIAFVNNNAFATGLTENNKTDAVLLFPNPAHDQLTVLSGDPSKNVYSVFDCTGKQCLLQRGGSSINTSDLKPGLYILRISAGESVLSRKIIIE